MVCVRSWTSSGGGNSAIPPKVIYVREFLPMPALGLTRISGDFFRNFARKASFSPEKTFLMISSEKSLLLIAFDLNVFLNLLFLLPLNNFSFHEKKIWNSNKKRKFLARLKIFNNFFICLIIRVCMFNRSWSTEHRYFSDRRRRIILKKVDFGKAEIRVWNYSILFEERWRKMIDKRLESVN